MMKKTIALLTLACVVLTGCSYSVHVTEIPAEVAAPEDVEVTEEPETVEASDASTEVEELEQDEVVPVADAIVIEYFFDEPCDACDESSEFMDVFSKQLEDVMDLYPYDIQAFNTFRGKDKAVLSAELARLDISEDVLKTFTGPIMIINGKAYLGLEEIERNLKEAFLVAGEDLFVNGRGVYDPSEEKSFAQLLESYPIQEDSDTCVYFYRIGCEECEELRNDFMDSLPEKVSVDGEEYDLQVIRINTRSGRNNEVIKAFFEKYQVPDEDQMVPIVFTGSGYLAGYDAITGGLMEKLESGDGLEFTYPEEPAKDEE